MNRLFKIIYLSLFCLILTRFSLAAGNEPILLIPLEKSASIYITKTLAYTLKKKVLMISDENLYPRQEIVEDRLKQLIKTKGIAKENLKATPHNLDLIEKYRLKILFHVRDLRQHVVSLAHHQLERKASFDIVQLYKQRGMDISGWDLEHFIEAIITYLPETIDMIGGWLKVYKEGKIPMLITSYEEFSDEGPVFFEKVFNFYSFHKAGKSLYNLPKTPYYHFRKGTKNEWKSVLSLEQKKQIEAMIPKEFFEFFRWERT